MTAEHPQVNFRATCADCDDDPSLPYTTASKKRAEMAGKAHVIDHPDHDVAVEEVRVVADGGRERPDPHWLFRARLARERDGR